MNAFLTGTWGLQTLKVACNASMQCLCNRSAFVSIRRFNSFQRGSSYVQHAPAAGRQAHSTTISGSRASKSNKKRKDVPNVAGITANGAALLDEDMLPGRRFIQNDEDEVEEAQGRRFMDAVVKIYCVHTEPNFSLPWQRKRQYATTSTGFLVQGGKQERWLLTNAHSVEYHTQVKVKRRGDDQKFIAEVLAIGTECDIALLTVKDDAFWMGVQPLELGSLPRLQDAVAVVGYPIGGDTISVTSGVVSRIEVTSYVHGGTELLGVQIDAAINSGNSGGPVFNGSGQCVGIAFQSMAGSDAENIGYVIPTPVVHHFLTDYRKNGSFTGFPAMGIQWQRMESTALRAAYKMSSSTKGVLVREIVPVADAAKKLKPDDIIMRFDGVQVACDGTVPFRMGERIAFSYLVSQKYTGEHARLDIWRDGREVNVEVKLDRPQPLVPLHLNGRDPSYLVVAGIVFVACCEPYLQSEYGGDYMSESPVKLLDRLLHGQKRSPDQQVVVLSQVLACDATLGYEDLFNVQVLKFNSQPITNLRHLAQMVQSNQENYMRFDMEYGEVVVLESTVAKAATQEVLALHSIPAAVSSEMQDVLSEPIAPLPAEAAEQQAAAGEPPQQPVGGGGSSPPVAPALQP